MTVDELKQALEVETDSALAARVGVERSTVAQWRRRDNVPKRWHFLVKLSEVEKNTLAARRRVFGDGDGYYIHMAALSLIDRDLLDWPMLTPHMQAAQAEEFILRAAAYIVSYLGDRQCSSFDDYWSLCLELTKPPHREAVKEWLHP